MPLIQGVRNILENCTDSLRIIYSGSSYSKPNLVAEYMSQAETTVRRYHKDLKEWFDEHYPSARGMDFLEMTIPAQTIDGFHQMQEGNIIKAMSILNMMHFISDEIDKIE